MQISNANRTLKTYATKELSTSVHQHTGKLAAASVCAGNSKAHRDGAAAGGADGTVARPSAVACGLDVCPLFSLELAQPVGLVVDPDNLSNGGHAYAE